MNGICWEKLELFLVKGFSLIKTNSYNVQEVSTRKYTTEMLCVDYRSLNSMMPPIVKAPLKAQVVLTLVSLPKID